MDLVGAAAPLPKDTPDARLRILHEISMALSRAPDVAELCREAVRLGTSRLGFDRIGIWFVDPEDPGWIVGTWGVDEEGRLRDERSVRLPRDPAAQEEVLYEGRLPFLLDEGEEVYDERHAVVGRSDRVAAPLWDGDRIAGLMTADNLLSSRRLGPADGEIFALLARTVAHISALKRGEAALKEALEAKAALLSELRHRTKNSFALISSLVSIEAMRAGDPAFEGTLRKLRDRISALTSLYDHLDRSERPERARLDEYLGRIALDLFEGYGAERKGIGLARSLESLEVDTKLAVPLGLIVNELITDSMKHAFPGGRRGTVSLSLERAEEGRAILAISDDGVGFPPGIAAGGSRGLGLALARTLCDQIGAAFAVGAGPGAAFEVAFPYR